MFDLIKSGVNTMKDPNVRKVVGLFIGGFCIGLGGGLIASSYE